MIFRYLVFCVPAVALLAGAGLAAARLVMRAVAAAVILALIVQAQLAIREPGTGMRAVSRFIAARERPGDAVIYPGTGIPPWYLAYPDGLGNACVTSGWPGPRRLPPAAMALRVTRPCCDSASGTSAGSGPPT